MLLHKWYIEMYGVYALPGQYPLKLLSRMFVKTKDPKEKPAKEGLTASPTEIEASRK